MKNQVKINKILNPIYSELIYFMGVEDIYIYTQIHKVLFANSYGEHLCIYDISRADGLTICVYMKPHAQPLCMIEGSQSLSLFLLKYKLGENTCNDEHRRGME